MATLQEAFEQTTRKWVTAPSGIEYEIRPLVLGLGSEGLDALIELEAQAPLTIQGEAVTEKTAPGGMIARMTPEERDITKHRLMDGASRGTLARRWNGIEERPAVPAEKWPGGDISFVYAEVRKAAVPLTEREMEDVRRTLPE